MYGCPSSRTTSENIRASQWRKNVAAVITQDRVIDGNFQKAN